MLPLPLFTSGAEVGLWGVGGVDVLLPNPFLIPLWGAADQSSAHGLGSSDPAPSFLLELYCDAFDLAVTQPLSLPRYMGGWGCSVSPLSPAGPQAAAARPWRPGWAMGGTCCSPCRPWSSWDKGKGSGTQCPE